MNSPKNPAGGIAAVAEMLNHLDEENRDRLLASVAQRDPELAQRIRERMFTFEDLVRLNDRDFQLLLREVPQAILALALRKAPEELKASIFRNLSKRTAGLLEEEIVRLGPQKLANVLAAQERIVATAKKLDSEKKISLMPSPRS